MRNTVCINKRNNNVPPFRYFFYGNLSISFHFMDVLLLSHDLFRNNISHTFINGMLMRFQFLCELPDCCSKFCGIHYSVISQPDLR